MKKNYNHIKELINKFSSSHIVMCMGDFNARLHYRLDSEKEALGPYIFGKGEEYVKHQSNNTTESRDQFVQFCLGTGMVVMNTQFKKKDKHYCTYKEMETEGFAPPWDTNRFATLDYCLIQDRWKTS